jgi:uncharacterized protein (DUF2062 family)
MIHLTRVAVRRWMETLLHIADSPKRTAAAYAVGVFFGFSPFLGLHTVLALACAFLFDLNRVAVLLGVYSNLPWIMGAWYAGVTAIAADLLNTKLPPGFRERLGQLFELSLFSGEFWRELMHLLRPLLWPYTLGSTVGALILAAVAYQLALAFVIARRRHPTWSSIRDELRFPKVRDDNKS